MNTQTVPSGYRVISAFAVPVWIAQVKVPRSWRNLWTGWKRLRNDIEDHDFKWVFIDRSSAIGACEDHKYVTDDKCLCESNARGAAISGWCHKHHTDWL